MRAARCMGRLNRCGRADCDAADYGRGLNRGQCGFGRGGDHLREWSGQGGAGLGELVVLGAVAEEAVVNNSNLLFTPLLPTQETRPDPQFVTRAEGGPALSARPHHPATKGGTPPGHPTSWLDKKRGALAAGESSSNVIDPAFRPAPQILERGRSVTHNSLVLANARLSA
jgi:hypothetical protein